MIDWTKFRPLHDRILVRLIPEPAPSDLIMTPAIAGIRSHTGMVVAVGPGKRNGRGRLMPMAVQPGDMVRFSLHDLEDGDYTLIRQGDIFGFVNA